MKTNTISGGFNEEFQSKSPLNSQILWILTYKFRCTLKETGCFHRAASVQTDSPPQRVTHVITGSSDVDFQSKILSKTKWHVNDHLRTDVVSVSVCSFRHSTPSASREFNLLPGVLTVFSVSLWVSLPVKMLLHWGVVCLFDWLMSWTCCSALQWNVWIVKCWIFSCFSLWTLWLVHTVIFLFFTGCSVLVTLSCSCRAVVVLYTVDPDDVTDQLTPN